MTFLRTVCFFFLVGGGRLDGDDSLMISSLREALSDPSMLSSAGVLGMKCDGMPDGSDLGFGTKCDGKLDGCGLDLGLHDLLGNALMVVITSKRISSLRMSHKSFSEMWL